MYMEIWMRMGFMKVFQLILLHFSTISEGFIKICSASAEFVQIRGKNRNILYFKLGLAQFSGIFFHMN